MGMNHKNYFIIALFLFLTGALAFAGEQNIRYPFVSGEFYPSDKVQLSQMIDGFLSKVPSKEKATYNVKILILPHAGYAYSGQTAAYGYQLIRNNSYDTAILIGPYHKAMFPGASIWRSGAWRTPLGDVPVDSELASAIFNESSDFQFIQDNHSTEHSLEVQLPFLQKVLTNFKIVPILISDPSPENYKPLAQAVFKNIKDKKVLIIASSDMSHYYPDSTAREMDSRTLAFLKDQDPGGLLKALYEEKSELCGHAAVLTALEISKLMGNTKLEVLNYATSADSTGDKSRVVGYGASVIYQQGEIPSPSIEKRAGNQGLDPQQRKELLKIARQTVEMYAAEGKIYQPNQADFLFKEDRATFVTIRKNGQLRGCIGSLTAEEPLILAVRDMAIQASSEDPRFPSVKKEELKDLNYEISVLSVPEKVKTAEEIILGKHGVILRKEGHSGVFLPKVAEELGNNKETFLNELCSQKAGLSKDCWQDPKTDIYVFTADEFSEAA